MIQARREPDDGWPIVNVKLIAMKLPPGVANAIRRVHDEFAKPYLQRVTLQAVPPQIPLRVALVRILTWFQVDDAAAEASQRALHGWIDSNAPLPTDFADDAEGLVYAWAVLSKFMLQRHGEVVIDEVPSTLPAAGLWSNLLSIIADSQTS